jgi:hypothetical protein
MVRKILFLTNLSKKMSSLLILGASCFVGKCLIASGHFPMPIKAVVRKIMSEADIAKFWADTTLAQNY